MNDSFHSGVRSTALLTDLYELTMAQGYWAEGMAEREAAFHLTFRAQPFGGGYAIACGLDQAIDYLRRLRFEPDDLAYLASLTGADGRPLFRDGFLDYLRRFRPRSTVHAMPEGTVVFPHEPLVRVVGPILEGQLIESALLNAVGFQTLVATKAARICQAAGERPVLEFGLRRAQGPDGAMAASRAAYVGGCAGTSNVLAGKTFGIPVKGTQAHSWVMAFENELDAFKAFARTAPNNCIFLVDTYDSLEGTRHAVEAAAELAGSGNRLLGIRLDSGDLVRLSIEARRILNASGHQRATIVGSGDLDERAIEQLDAQGASIDVFGVGTRLVTAQDDPALTVVYKLTAVCGDDGRWEPRVKLSEEAAKSTVPGVLQVRRFSREWQFMADAVYDEHLGIECPSRVVDPADPSRSKNMLAHWVGEDLLVREFDRGEPVGPRRSIEAARERCRGQLERLHPVVKRLSDPQPYAVGIEERLHALRTSLAARMRPGGDATEDSNRAKRPDEADSQ